MARGVLMEGSVNQALRKMALPMAVGMVCMILVNIIDTFWVGRLGTDALAAMAFTFPVVGMVFSLSAGLMVGTSTAVARAIGLAGAGARLCTHAFLLGLAFVGLGAGLGLAFQGRIYALLGAEAALIPLVEEYMTIWFVGVVFLIVPLVANGALRATGDATTPMRVMMLAAGCNFVLDPIFGAGPVPAMGLRGAAIATLISRVVGCYVLWVLGTRTSLLDLHVPASSSSTPGSRSCGSGHCLHHQRARARGGGPADRHGGLFGPSALAVYAIGSRVDALLMAPNALGGALIRSSARLGCPPPPSRGRGHPELAALRDRVGRGGLGAALRAGPPDCHDLHR